MKTNNMAACSCRLLSVILTHCFVAFILVCRTSRAFNIDTKSPIIKLGQTDSYFGFSLTHHFVQNRRTGAVTPVLLVGAPRDNVTDSEAPDTVRQLVRPGAVYQCPLTSFRDDCTAVKVDREESVDDSDRNDQWLGVTVVSQATDDGKAMACAHRYKLSNDAYRWGLGQCFSLTNSLDEDEIWSPCDGRPRQAGHGEYGFCQAGISAAISQDDELVMGAPGPYNWRGALFMNKLVGNLDDDVRWLQSPVEDSTPARPMPEPATGFYSYLGMSVKMARFNGTTWYVGGAPRSKNVGQVLLFQRGAVDSPFLSINSAHTLTGEQFGAGFGYDVAVADFNLDLKEDLVVGAPFYHAPGVGGAIYVYYNSEQGITSLTEPQRIFSRRMKDQECLQLDCRNARFGFALAAAGDVDRDGFQDLAVGAPYEGSGAVYIFRGSSRGLSAVYSQRISASDFAPVVLRAFGAALSNGNDVDNNGYADISVGAFSSNAVVLLRARPVVNILKEIVTEPQLIDPRQSVCPIDGSSNKCFLVKLCFRFTAEPRERFTGPMTLRYWLDTERYSTTSKLARAVFVRRRTAGRSAETTQLDGTLRMNEQTNVNYQCVNHTGYIVKTNRDFLNPILIHLSYNLTDIGDPILTPGQPLNDINKYPVVNNAASQTNFSVDFVKNCGDDHQCHSSIGVKAFMTSLEPDGESDTSYILRVGESDVTALRIEMKNNGEDAHEASLTITLPPSLEYLGTDSQGDEKYTCSPDDNILHCAIGNPLPAGHGALLSIRLDTQHATSSIEPLNITVQANTTSIELNTEDDRVVIYLQVVVETDLLLRGSSDPNQLVFGGDVVGESAVEFEHNIGPELLVTFEVKNVGNAAVPKASLSVWWPYETSRGQHLLYLLDEPVVYEGSEVRGYCRYDPFWINTLNIKPSSGRGIEASVTSPVRGSPASRRRRDVMSQSTTSQLERRSLSTRTSVSLSCEDGSAKCRQFVCELGLMLPKASIAFKFRARLWNSTFVENFAEFDGVKIVTRSVVSIDPRLNIKQSNYLNDKILLETLAIPDISVQGPPGIPLWIIIVSIIAGVILLILVIIILWKCGFFQRHRSSDIGKHKANFQEYHD